MDDGPRLLGEAATFRELTAFKDEMRDEVHELKLRQARLDHMPDSLRELGAKMDKVLDAQRTPAAASGDALALHNIADAMRKSAEANRTPVAELIEVLRQPRGNVLDTMVKIGMGGLLAWTLLQGLST